MTTLPWLDYEGQTTGQLLGSADSHRVDSVVCAFEQAIQEKEADGARLSPEEQLILAVKALQGEVNNGGFHQFFTDSSCEYVRSIVECLLRIGAPQTAEVAATALAALRLRVITPKTVREATEEALMQNTEDILDALDDCDQRFYQLRGENLDDKLFTFIESNAERILT